MQAELSNDDDVGSAFARDDLASSLDPVWELYDGVLDSITCSRVDDLDALAAAAPHPPRLARQPALRITTHAFCDSCGELKYAAVNMMALVVAARARAQNFGACTHCTGAVRTTRVQVEVQCSRCVPPRNVIAKYECVYATECPLVSAVPAPVLCPRCS